MSPTNPTSVDRHTRAHHAPREETIRPSSRHRDNSTPPLNLALGDHFRSPLLDVLPHLPRLPFSIPAGVGAPVSPHCIDNHGQTIAEFAETVTRDPRALETFLRDVAHQVVDSGQHDILLTAGLKAGRYANGLEVPAGEDGRTGATYTMRLGVHNGRLSGTITVTPSLIQHGPAIPGTSIHLPDFVTAMISTIDISQDAQGRIEFNGNILGSPFPLPITDQVTPMLFGTSERVLVSTPSALTERIIAYYTADPRRAQGINMADPNTISLTLASNEGAQSNTGPRPVNQLHLGPITISDIDLTAHFEAHPSEQGFRLEIPHTGLRELRVHTNALCAGAATPDATLSNTSIRNLVLDVRFRDAAHTQVYVHSFSAEVDTGSLNINGDIVANAQHHAPLTLNGNGTPEGRFTLNIGVPAQGARVAVNVGETPVSVSGFSTTAANYTLTIPNVFDPLHTVASFSGTPSTVQIAHAAVGNEADYHVTVDGVTTGSRNLSVSASLGGFNPLSLLNFDFAHATWAGVLDLIGSHNPTVNVALSDTTTHINGVAGYSGTERIVTLASDPTTFGAITVIVSGQTGARVRASEGNLPQSVLTADVGVPNQRNQRLRAESRTSAANIGLDFSVTPQGALATNATLPTISSQTTLSASAPFLRWARGFLPQNIAQRLAGVTLPAVALNANVQGGVSMGTRDGGHTHQLHAAIRARNVIRAAGARVVTNDTLTADVGFIDQAAHTSAEAPRVAVAAGANRLTAAHRVTVGMPGIPSVTLAGNFLVSDDARGNITARDQARLTVPSILRNASDLRLATNLPTANGAYQMPTRATLTGSLVSGAAAHDRRLPQGATLGGSLQAANRFTVDLPSGDFHNRGNSDLGFNAIVPVGEGDGRVAFNLRDRASLTASVASPPRFQISDSMDLMITTPTEISTMTPGGALRVGPGVRIPVAIRGGGVSGRINSISGLRDAARAWGVGAPDAQRGSHTTSPGGRPHGSR